MAARQKRPEKEGAEEEPGLNPAESDEAVGKKFDPHDVAASARLG